MAISHEAGDHVIDHSALQINDRVLAIDRGGNRDPYSWEMVVKELIPDIVAEYQMSATSKPTSCDKTEWRIRDCSLWIRARDAVRVLTTLLEVGDVVIAIGGSNPVYKDDYIRPITVMDLSGGQITAQYTNGEGKLLTGNYNYWHKDTSVWIRPRSVQSMPTTSTSIKRVIPEFPHDCTRCGAKAYVGAFEVVHKNEAAAIGCPARRG